MRVVYVTDFFDFFYCDLKMYCIKGKFDVEKFVIHFICLSLCFFVWKNINCVTLSRLKNSIQS